MDVTPIRLDNAEFEGDNTAYLVESDRTVLVDTGTGSETGRRELERRLADEGAAFADVDEVWLTHWHWDHAGLAADVQAESGATVRIHEADAPMVADPDAVERGAERRDRRLAEWGVPDEKRAVLNARIDRQKELAGGTPDVTTFEDGASLTVGDEAFEVLHLPGHAAGLSAFVRDGAAFVGDAILPKYTPNVGGADVRVERPLARYVESLVRICDREFDVAYPGHREPIEDPTGRSLAILDHHRERTERIVDVLSTHGPCDAWTVSAHLFGELEGIHILHGPGEAFAHLDHLVAHDAVTVDGREYALRGAAPDVDDLFPRATR